MGEVNIPDDRFLLKRLRKGDSYAFAAIFSRYYRSLVLYCNSFITDMDECEDIVMDLFVAIWEHRERLDISNLRSFLLRSVRHDCLDAIKHRRVKDSYSAALLLSMDINSAALDNYILYDELKKLVDDTLSSLDAKSVAIFKMSRWDGVKYDDIAKSMNISRRTVEVRITNVIRQLRATIKKHFPTI